MMPEMSDSRKLGFALAATTAASGLTAGLHNGWAMAVMPGLAGLDDRAFVGAIPYLDDAIRRDPAVRDWLAVPAEMRLIGSAYDAGLDDRYTMRAESLNAAFDGITYVDGTGPARLLP